MRIIHNINKWSFILTMLLYITIYYGMLAQILLGCIQVCLAIILLFHWYKFNLRKKRHLLIYVFIASCYGLFWLTDIVDSDYGFIFLTAVPMSIAGYFVYITNLIQDVQNNNVRNIQKPNLS